MMTSGSLSQALLLLTNAVGSFFCILFLLRFMMQWGRVSFAGQLGEFVLKLTNWAIKPLRRIVPGFGGVDWASLVAAFLLQLAYVGLLFSLTPVAPLSSLDWNFGLMLLLSVFRELLRLVIYLVMGVVFLEALLSWFNPYSPLAAPISQLSRPILRPLRRVIPPVAGIDLTPLVLLLFLQVLLVLL
ncbi:MAG: YggT family protein [Zoogloeaceae bacterium]|jgi:YggT family protein|nr:YggT family protein [Zoogloeaceae bacterium]